MAFISRKDLLFCTKDSLDANSDCHGAMQYGMINDLKNENSKLREENKDMSETLARANEFIKDLEKHLKKALNVIKVIREIFEKLEQAIGRNKYRNLMNDVSRDNAPMIKAIQMFDKQIHPEEYQEEKNTQKRDRGRGR